jgi:GntR family transcriptional regulator, rspAB operon transcriptional repressor
METLAQPGPPARKAARTEAVSLRERAYRSIREKIITCELRPGEALSEGALSQALGIGRTPVHQALDRLMLEGLVDVLPRKGVIVRPLSLDEVVDIIDVRLVNETWCARLVAERATAAEIAALEDNLARFGRAVEDRDLVRLMRLDEAFHLALSGAARNPVLADLLRTLHSRSLRFWFVSLRAADHYRRVAREHAAIVATIRQRSPADAEGAMRAHIEAFRANLVRHL